MQELPEFAEAVLEVVDAIPPGKVLAYGDVAELVGHGGPRRVGHVLSRYGGMTCWWRVLRADGTAAPALEQEAVARWRSEGTPMVGGALARRVDLTRARWDGQREGGGSVGGA
ncbi:MAG TPA: MGMT family protein [Dermatophilaceae bacterium]|nr:MGMT family protein [Dermatophilaceae bacterium]